MSVSRLFIYKCQKPIQIFQEYHPLEIKSIPHH